MDATDPKHSLLSRTWKALQAMELDPSCSRSVNRYQKLTVLWMALQKSIAKDDAKEAELPEDISLPSLDDL